MFPFKFDGVKHHECILVSVYIIPVIPISKTVEKKNVKLMLFQGGFYPPWCSTGIDGWSELELWSVFTYSMSMSHHWWPHTYFASSPNVCEICFQKEEETFFSVFVVTSFHNFFVLIVFRHWQFLPKVRGSISKEIMETAPPTAQDRKNARTEPRNWAKVFTEL